MYWCHACSEKIGISATLVFPEKAWTQSCTAKMCLGQWRTVGQRSKNYFQSLKNFIVIPQFPGCTLSRYEYKVGRNVWCLCWPYLFAICCRYVRLEPKTWDMRKEAFDKSLQQAVVTKNYRPVSLTSQIVLSKRLDWKYRSGSGDRYNLPRQCCKQISRLW